MNLKSLLSIISLLGIYFVSGQSFIMGKVVDAESNEPLPFTTLSFVGTTTGTVSNAQGLFRLQIPQTSPSDSLLISYIGYESKTYALHQMPESVIIRLNPAVVQLEALVILPLSPEEYIRKAVRKFPSNYANEPFTTTAYYREVFTENKQYIHLNEGVFFTSYPDYQDTIPNQHQLALYRSTTDKEQIDFMHGWVEDKKAKEKKKALKKGEEWDEEDTDAREIIQMGFGGPEEILALDLMKETEYCLDTTKLKKFRYQFGKGLSYQGRDMMEILFESKGQVDHQRMKGVIHIDLETDAIVSVAYRGELVIPVVAQPILFAFGLGIKDPFFNKSLKYQYHNGRWYPDTFQWDVSLGLKKRYVFKPNEYSDFTGHQIFKVNDIDIAASVIIEEEMRFDPEEDPTQQVHPINTLEWHTVNTLPLEDLTGN
jgi:hypothetical protein